MWLLLYVFIVACVYCYCHSYCCIFLWLHAFNRLLPHVVTVACYSCFKNLVFFVVFAMCVFDTYINVALGYCCMCLLLHMFIDAYGYFRIYLLLHGIITACGYCCSWLLMHAFIVMCKLWHVVIAACGYLWMLLLAHVVIVFIATCGYWMWL